MDKPPQNKIEVLTATRDRTRRERAPVQLKTD